MKRSLNSEPRPAGLATVFVSIASVSWRARPGVCLTLGLQETPGANSLTPAAAPVQPSDGSHSRLTLTALVVEGAEAGGCTGTHSEAPAHSGVPSCWLGSAGPAPLAESQVRHEVAEVP